jgi:beta-lactam-binding protein with PASTA domain
MKIPEIIKQIKSLIISKHFLKHFGLVILFYLLFVFGSIFYLNFATNHGEKIPVPNLVGLSSEEAKKKIEDLGLQYEILDSVYDPNSPLFKKPEGTVFEQVIEPTSSSNVYVKSGRIIGIRLTKKTQLVEMPNLVFKQIHFAQSILDGRGLRFIIRYRQSEESNGSVIDQLYNGKKITQGTRIPIGSLIILVVGQLDIGIPFQIPNLVGLYRDEALKILDSLKISSYNVVCADCFTHEDSISALIFYQSPEYLEGENVFKSSHFSFSMSVAPYIDPEITEIPQE